MITVRHATMAEYDDVEKFYCELIESMRDTEYKPEWKMGVYPTEQMLKDAIEEQTLYLAHLENDLVGVMMLNHDYEPEYERVKWLTDAKKDEIMAIHTLGVSHTRQRQGIAGQMVLYVIEKCRQDSIKTIRLDVLKKNVPAAKLYTSMGFKFIDSVKIYYEDTGLTDFQLYEFVL